MMCYGLVNYDIVIFSFLLIFITDIINDFKDLNESPESGMRDGRASARYCPVIHP
jgi:hypothetical protein